MVAEQLLKIHHHIKMESHHIKVESHHIKITANHIKIAIHHIKINFKSYPVHLKKTLPPKVTVPSRFDPTFALYFQEAARFPQPKADR